MADRSVLVRLRADASQFNREIAGASGPVHALVANLEAADNRMANIIQTGMALAPALVPIGGLAVPAVAALTTQLGFAAVGIGATVLAFQGLGDAIGAVNDYRLEPTADNFAKMREELNKLGPAGQEFALYIDSIRGDLQRLQDVSQAGALPGFEDSIDSMLTRLPEVERILFAVSAASGDLMAEAGDNLADPRWDEFFSFLETDAYPILTELGKTTGNLAEGIANIVMASQPLGRDFSGGLLDWSRDFADATANLESSEGFQDFVAYIQENGPGAVDALGALGNAVVQLVSAAAPVGTAVLPVIEGLADGLAAIADSPVGPVLIGAAAAVGTFGRSLALLRAVGLRGDGTSVMANVLDAGKIRQGATALTTVTSAQDRARLSAAQLLEVEEKRAASVRQGIAQAGKNAALIGGFALAMSGAAENTGLANTATLALMGTIAGPWGAAIGGGVGLVMDLAAANNDAVESTKALHAAQQEQSVSFTQSASMFRDRSRDIDEYNASVARVSSMGSKSLSDVVRATSDLFTNQSEEGREAAENFERNFNRMKVGAAELYAELNNGSRDLFGASNAQLDEFVNEITPALERAGISVREALSNGHLRPEAVDAIRAYNSELDSASGRSQAVADALNQLEGEMVSNTSAAENLATALDNLFGVELSASAAADAAVVALREMRSTLNETNGALKGNGEAALESREAIRGYISAQLDMVKAQAAADGSGRQAAQSLLAMRENAISAARAAGASREEIRGMVREMGLTPRSIRTIIQTPGLLSAQEQVKALARLYDLTPKQVKTLVSEAGAEPTRAKVRALAREYDLTPKQVRTFLEATDNASAKAKTAKKNADNLKGTYSANLAAIDRASGIIAGVASRLAGLNGNRADTYIYTHHINTVTNKVENQLGPVRGADGMTVPGARRPYGDKVFAFLAPGEEVISNRFGQADRHRGLLKQISANRLADGGTAGHRGGPADLTSLPRDPERRADIVRILIEIRDLKKALAATGGDAVVGLERKKTQAELAAAVKDLRETRGQAAEDRKAAAQERREAARERARTIREGANAFDLIPDESTPGGDVRQQFRDLAKVIREVKGQVPDSFDKLADRGARLADKIAEFTTKVETAERDLEDVIQRRSDFETAVAGSFDNDIFGKGLDHFFLQLEADTNDINAMNAALQQLVGLGLDTAGPLGGLFQALASSGDLSTAQQLAAGGVGLVGRAEAAFAGRAGAQAGLAGFSGEAAFGQAVRDLEQALTRQQERLDNRVARLEEVQRDALKEYRQAVRGLGKDVKEGSEKGAERGVAAGFSGWGRDVSARARAGGR